MLLYNWCETFLRNKKGVTYNIPVRPEIFTERYTNHPCKVYHIHHTILRLVITLFLFIDLANTQSSTSLGSITSPNLPWCDGIKCLMVPNNPFFFWRIRSHIIYNSTNNEIVQTLSNRSKLALNVQKLSNRSKVIYKIKKSPFLDSILIKH